MARRVPQPYDRPKCAPDQAPRFVGELAAEMSLLDHSPFGAKLVLSLAEQGRLAVVLVRESLKLPHRLAQQYRLMIEMGAVGGCA